MKTFKTQLLGLILLLGTTTIIDAQGVSVSFEPTSINNPIEEDRIATNANNEIKKHIEANLNYPEQLKEFALKGTSFIRFRIDEKGEITAKNIITSMGAAFDKAILQSVENLNSVSPVYKNGVATAYAIVVPVRFEP